jgi:glycerol-3-phosphate dehydrogenase (NAD(P)+)
LATALAPQSRNRRGGELLAQGVSAEEIPGRIGQAVEALETAPLLARGLGQAEVTSPITGALAELIEGRRPLDERVALVRATVPPPARFRRGRPGFLRRAWTRIRGWFAREERGGSEPPDMMETGGLA